MEKQEQTFDIVKTAKISEVQWQGGNTNYVEFWEQNLKFQNNHVKYQIKIMNSCIRIVKEDNSKPYLFYEQSG